MLPTAGRCLRAAHSRFSPCVLQCMCTPAGMVVFWYALCGFFGASLFGDATQGNIMMNHICRSTPQCLLLYFGMLIYVCFGNAVAQYPLGASVDLLIVGDKPPTLARTLSVQVSKVPSQRIGRYATRLQV